MNYIYLYMESSVILWHLPKTYGSVGVFILHFDLCIPLWLYTFRREWEVSENLSVTSDSDNKLNQKEMFLC